jgi:3-oxoacyl-[acyl-carrier-protein] synthase-1
VKISGHTGIAECLADAANELSVGEIEVAIVGGADTLLEEDTLNWLTNTGRLKTPERPAGLVPGEAGAFLVLETVTAANARRANIWGILRDLRFADDSRPLFSGKPPLGVALAQVASGVAEASDWTEGAPVWFITDQNGESYRAKEWGHALLRLVRTSKTFAQPALWYPARSFGDTGAVTGALAICLATSAFKRGYAPAATVGLLSSADTGRRAAALIQMPERIAS